MKLSVKERLVLFSLLPGESNFRTYQTLKAMRNVLTITEDEKKVLNFRDGPTPGTVIWDEDKAEAKNVIITADGLKIIKDALEQLDKQSKLTAETAELYERFLDVEAEVVEKVAAD